MMNVQSFAEIGTLTALHIHRPPCVPSAFLIMHTSGSSGGEHLGPVACIGSCNTPFISLTVCLNSELIFVKFVSKAKGRLA